MEKSKINIILLSESSIFTSFIINNLSNNNIVNVLACVKNINEFNGLTNIIKDTIVVLDVILFKEELIDKIVECLEMKGLYFLSVCEDSNIGFEMMKKGSLVVSIRKNVNTVQEQQAFLRTFALKIKDAYNIRGLMGKREIKKEVKVSSNKIIAIGSSTGGTEAVLKVLQKLPAEIPPMLIVQHMPPVFTRMYADRLNDVCQMTVWEAKNGDKLKPGLALLAPGDYQMKVVRKIDGLYVSCVKSEKVNGHAPSVDVLFDSVADVAERNAIGVILTGMGGDGAKGLLKMKQKGAFTIGQDEKSCIVYGMPKVAYDMGAVTKQMSLENIASCIMNNI